ncbi:hypothetical protein [Aeromonas sp. FDAARGOS 1419]|uniref:hypothetical protein n=1 Tax=Aeromonas sp. FDAARGOS 1419 TaxID=2778068 RepID=UPI001C21B578|nr:hypothetical protein [Aeromonas sp. FDAARGOS 1419]QWZ78094.1 hypothetical protein I6L49_03685 [Aeromonas sp. FDAARGOS 1419]
MITLLLTTALIANENTTIKPAAKTFYFFGVVPTATCEIDQYDDEKLYTINTPIKCPDKNQVLIKQETVVLNGNITKIWVIEYENIK